MEKVNETDHILNIFKSALNVIAEAILIVEKPYRYIFFNNQFAKVWKIPPELMERKEREAILQYIAENAENPEPFLKTVEECNANPEKEAVGELKFKDGRIVEFHSFGCSFEKGREFRIWICRDVTLIRSLAKQLKEKEISEIIQSSLNKELIINKIKTAIQSSTHTNPSFAICSIKMDFAVSSIIDSLIQEAISKELCGRLLSLAQSSRTDIVARHGSDEIVFLKSDVKDVQDVLSFGVNLYQICNRPFFIAGNNESIPYYCGITLFPKDGNNVEELLNNAEIAKNYAREKKGERFQIYNEEIRKEKVSKITLKKDLSKAIDNHEIYVVFQPIFSLDEKKIVGFESLARWQRADGSMVSPATFVAVAEEDHIIISLEEYLLYQTFMSYQKLARPDLFISINIASTHLKDKNFSHMLKRMIDHMNINPNKIELEVTERVFLGEQEETLSTLKQLEKMGIRLVIDDFGIEYSCLMYLRKFSFDKIKIDQSFVRAMMHDEKGKDIVKTIITMGACLKLEVLAEGIETQQEFDFLKENRCLQGQGYFLAKPLKIEEICLQSQV